MESPGRLGKGYWCQFICCVLQIWTLCRKPSLLSSYMQGKKVQGEKSKSNIKH